MTPHFEKTHMSHRECPWYFDRFTQAQRSLFLERTGAEAAIAEHTRLNDGIYYTDLALNPVGGYSNCLFLAIDAAVSRRNAY